MEVLSVAVPLGGEELAQQIRDGKAIFSTRLGRFPPREARPCEAPIIMRSDPEHDVEDMISRLRREYPRECRLIMVPIKNLFDYFDHYDVQLHGTGIIYAVLMGIATHNARRADNIRTFAESWRHFCGDRFWGITPETQDLFTPFDVERYGNDFLDDALAYLKDARMAIQPVALPVSSGFIPSAVASPTLFNDPAIIASQVSSRHSSGQSSTSSMALKDSVFGQRHASVHSEPENKILRSIRPSLLRNSSNPEGLETAAPSSTNPTKLKNVEAYHKQSAAVVSGVNPSAIQPPKTAFAQKIHAASSSRTAPIPAPQYPVQQGMDGLYGAHLHNVQNYRSHGFTETARSRPHGAFVETPQVSQGTLPVRANGVQTMRHFDRQKMRTHEAASRRLSGLAPPPPPHLIEPFPPFVPYAPPNQQISTSDMHEGPYPIMNSGLHGSSFEDRKYHGFTFAENSMAPQGQPQRPTNTRFPLPNVNPPGSVLSIPKTRNLQNQISAPRVLPMDPRHGPPVAVQRPPTGQLPVKSMPLHSPFMPFSNDARVMNDAEMAAEIAATNQRLWQQQMQEQARSSEVQSSNGLGENSRPAERGDRRFSHKRGRGSYSHHRSSPPKRHSDQLNVHHRESGISSHGGSDIPVSLPHQAVSEYVPEHRGMSLPGQGAQSQTYSWKQYGNPMFTESPKAASLSDEHSHIVTGQSSWHSPHIANSSWNNTLMGPGNHWSDEDTEPDKLYISGDGVSENDVRDFVEPIAKIAWIKAGNNWKNPGARPFYFVSFATEEDARRVEAALNGYVLANSHERLKVSKARVYRRDSRRYPQYDRHSGYYQGSRSYPSNQFRNHSVPDERMENRSQAFDTPTLTQSLADMRSLPQTPKTKYQHSEPGSESVNFNGGTVRRKKPSKISIRPIAEESPAAQYDHNKNKSAKLESDKLASTSQGDEAGIQKQTKGQIKGGKHGRKTQPSASVGPRTAERVSGTWAGQTDHLASQTVVHKPQHENQYSSKGRFIEPKSRPVSLGDFMLTSALDNSPERFSDHSEQKPNDGSPTRKHRNQSGNIKSKPKPRKESFPALNSKRGISSTKTQGAIGPTSSDPIVGHSQLKQGESKPQDPPTTPLMGRQLTSDADFPAENPEQLRKGAQISDDTIDTSKQFVKPSDSMDQSSQVQQTAEHRSSIDHQHVGFGTPAQPYNSSVETAKCSTSANPAVSALVSESWANELTSPEDFDDQSTQATSKVSKCDPPSLEFSSSRNLESKVSEETNPTSSGEAAKISIFSTDEIAVSTTIVEEDLSHKPAVETDSLVGTVKEPEAHALTTYPPSSAKETASTVQLGSKKQFHPDVPPRKYHPHEMSRSETSIGDSVELPTHQIQSKPKQNKEKKTSNKAIVEGHLTTRSLNGAEGWIDQSEIMASVPTSVAITTTSTETPLLDSPQPMAAIDLPMTNARDQPALPFEVQTSLPRLDESRLTAKSPEPLNASEGALQEPVTTATLRSSNVNVPPRTSSIAPTTGPISTHKKKQKTPTKEAAKKTKKQTAKKSSTATKREVQPVAKSGSVVETSKQSESKVDRQEPNSQPEARTEVSYLQDPTHEEVVDVSDQCTRRPEYPSLDQTNAVYCVRGPTVITRSDIPFFLCLFPKDSLGQADDEDKANTLKPTKDNVDVARLNDVARPPSDTGKGGKAKQDAKEEDLSDLGTPQLTFHDQSGLPPSSRPEAGAKPTTASNPQSDPIKPNDEPNAQSKTTKSKKKSNKKKKKAKTQATTDDKPELSASIGLEEKSPIPTVGLPLKQRTKSVNQSIFSKSDRFVADPDSYAQEILSKAQGSKRPALNVNNPDPFAKEVKKYYAKKEVEYAPELARVQESFGMDPYSPHRYGRGSSNSPQREGDSHSTQSRPTYVVTDRKIELLNSPTFPQSDKDVHGLGITADSVSGHQGRDIMTHKRLECDNFSDPPLAPFTAMTPARPTSTTSELIRTPSDSTSPETVTSDGQDAGMDKSKPSPEASKDESPATRASVAKLDVNENEMAARIGNKSPPVPPPSPQTDGVMNKSSTTTIPAQLPTIVNEKLSEDYLEAVGQLCDCASTSDGPGVLGLSTVLGKMALAEDEEFLSFSASRLKEDRVTGDDTKHDEASADREKNFQLFPSELESDSKLESLFFSDERVIPKTEQKSIGALVKSPSEEHRADEAKPSAAFSSTSTEIDEEENSKCAMADVLEYQDAKDTSNRLKKEAGTDDSLATFVSEINFEVDPSDPIIQRFANLSGLQQPIPSESAEDKAFTVEGRADTETQHNEALAPDFPDRMALPKDHDYSKDSKKEKSPYQDHVPDTTGRATRASSEFSDIADANIVSALRSLPNGSPERTIVRVVSRCMELDLPEEDAVDKEVGSTSFATGALVSKSVTSPTMNTRPKKWMKKRAKKVLKESSDVQGSTPSAWAHFAANVEKDEAAQREARRQDQEKREVEKSGVEGEKGGVVPCELNLEAMSQTWRKIETGDTGYRRLEESLTTANEVSIQDVPKPDLNIEQTETVIDKSELDKASNESTSEDDSELTLKPSRSPDPPEKPNFQASIDAVLASSTLDTIPESVESTRSKTPSVSPSRVAKLRSPILRHTTGKTATIDPNTSFPALPPPSVFALSDSSSPVQELSEDVIAMHNSDIATPQRRHRGSSSIHSEYSTTSSTLNTNVFPSSGRRPLPPSKEPSWSNIAASSGNSNVRLSPSRNTSTTMSPAQNLSTRLSPTRRFTRTRADTRSSLAQSIALRESEEEDTQRRGRSTTPAGGQKEVVRRQGTAPKRRREGDEWSVPSGEKMWGSSSEA